MSIKVLVADDSVTIQKVICIIFGGDEYSLTIVDNGKSAIDKAREVNPDILLIDALMPGMTGYEVSELVRATPLLATKPILLLTGSFEPFDEEKAKKCGADDFIAKPFESQQIITKVHELLELGRKRAFAAPPQPVVEPPREQVTEVAAPVAEIPTPVAFFQSEASKVSEPTDIWGAFTPEVSPFAESKGAVDRIEPSSFVEPSFVEPFEANSFAIVTEELDVQRVKPAVNVEPPLQQPAGNQWFPVEESTVEFEDEIPPLPLTPAVEAPAPFQEPSADEISFENSADFAAAVSAPIFASASENIDTFSVPASEAFSVAAPVVEEAAAPIAVSDAVAPVETALPITLTEEQLKAALASASKEVIERIVWEVVPDLAEALIRDAIKKIQEGV